MNINGNIKKLYKLKSETNSLYFYHGQIKLFIFIQYIFLNTQ